MTEVWKEHPDFNGLVLVSTFGNVKSYYHCKEGKLLTNRQDNGCGYERLVINHHKYYIHRLVAQTFIPNPENKREVNHKDGNKQNNHVSNLEWVTRSENQKLAYKLGLQKPSEKQRQAIIKTNELKRKKVAQLDDDGNVLQIFDSVKLASESLHTSASFVSLLCRNLRTSKKFNLRYIDG